MYNIGNFNNMARYRSKGALQAKVRVMLLYIRL